MGIGKQLAFSKETLTDLEISMRRPSIVAPLALSLISLVLGGCPSGDERPNSSTSNYVEDRGHVFSDDDSLLSTAMM